MAYVYSGSMMHTNVKNPPYSSGDAKTVTSTSIFLDKGYALYATVRNDDSSIFMQHFEFFAIPKNPKIGQYSFERILRRYDVNDVLIEETSENVQANKFPTGLSLYSTYTKRYYAQSFVQTTIPLFNADDTESINKYINKGDTSGAIKDASTKWNLYIDGTKNPLYKLTWDCPDIPSSDTSKVKVLFCAKDDAIANTYIVKDSHYYNYNNKSVKLNYHDIHEAVWGDMGGLVKGAVTIIVQFEYFDTTTVVPKDTSSYMYCELYPNETNGHMYGNIGFCKVGEHSTWFVKTDSGDSSTFTAHDGTKGSDGYTKDDDKGYDDNKDKDDDDDDTLVLSSGIGVLTSTFHMTKERLVQLGQFLWGSSIFDEFSLINNNPIENIISCKAIP